jgi:hypothetical protein
MGKDIGVSMVALNRQIQVLSQILLRVGQQQLEEKHQVYRLVSRRPNPVKVDLYSAEIDQSKLVEYLANRDNFVSQAKSYRKTYDKQSF